MSNWTNGSAGDSTKVPAGSAIPADGQTEIDDDELEGVAGGSDLPVSDVPIY